jgi:hypothetical protein
MKFGETISELAPLPRKECVIIARVKTIRDILSVS